MPTPRLLPGDRVTAPASPENGFGGTEQDAAREEPRRRLPGWVSAALREPLLHFLVLGLGLWAAQRAFVSAPAQRIELSADTVTQLDRDFTRRSGHGPTATEQAALLREYLDSEILYREALQRGLLRGDVIVRRRLIQKMEFLAEALPELTPQESPTEAQLQALLEKDAERYRIPARQALRQVFIARRPDEPDAALTARAQALRQRLDQGEPAARLGDPFPRGSELPPLSATELDGLFGPGFSSSVAPLPLDQWSSPIPSSYGLHLVLVSARQPEQTPSLATVRERVRADWEEGQRGPRREAALQRLWQRYDVRIAGKPAARTTTASTVSAGTP